MKRSTSILVTTWFVLITLVPALLGVGGVRASARDNRELRTVPDLNPRRWLDPDTWAEVSGALDDHLPGRDQAVDARRIIDQVIFGDSTNPDVLRGRDGWLFLADSYRLVCFQTMTPAQLVDRAERLRSLGEQSGTPVTIYLVPDKLWVAGEAIGRSPGRDCSERRRAELRKVNAARQRPPIVDSWTDFETWDGAPLFWRGDSHLSPTGELLMARQLIDAVSPGLFDPAEVGPGPVIASESDLYTLLGETFVEKAPSWKLNRPGADTTFRRWPSDQPPPQSWRPLGEFNAELLRNPIAEFRTTGGAPVVPGTTLVVHDSQIAKILDRLATFFEHVVFVEYEDFGFDPPPAVQHWVPDADRIVIETVERASYGRLLGGTGRLVLGER